MIKINLLPASVFEKQIVRRLIALFGALLVFVIVACAGTWLKLTGDVRELNSKLEAAKIVEDRVNTLRAQKTSKLGELGPIEGKVKFVQEVMAYNLKAPALYDELARFTYEKIRYRQISLSDTGQDMQINAYAPSLADAGRYLLNLYRATHIFSQVSMSQVPGYTSSGQSASGPAEAVGRLGLRGSRRGGAGAVTARGFSFTVNCKLTQPLTAPSYGGQAGGGATPGASPSPTPGGGAPLR